MAAQYGLGAALTIIVPPGMGQRLTLTPINDEVNLTPKPIPSSEVHCFEHGQDVISHPHSNNEPAAIPPWECIHRFQIPPPQVGVSVTEMFPKEV